MSYTTFHSSVGEESAGLPVEYYDRRKANFYLGMAVVAVLVSAVNGGLGKDEHLLAWMGVAFLSGAVFIVAWAKTLTTPVHVEMPAASELESAESFIDVGDLAELRERMHLLDPIEFENLVGLLLTRMGFDVSLTPRSGDGGVDLIAFDKTPVKGGYIVVQCKHTASVGSPEVRDLAGVVQHHGANKGILITSGRFSSQAREWAAGKPLELVDGDGLLQLIEENR
jgi:hypothetical protein